MIGPDMLDARLKEEYQDERAHIGLMNSEEFDGFDDLADYSTNTLIDFPTDNPVSNLVDETGVFEELKSFSV